VKLVEYPTVVEKYKATVASKEEVKVTEVAVVKEPKREW
jgi:hypothetical protein